MTVHTITKGVSMKPKVSVICIVYNSMVYLPRTVASVLAQTFTDFELIIVNDGSSDNVVEWVSSLEDPRIKLITQVNKGIPGARNTGIEHARGEYLAFLDGDDLWAPIKLKKQVQCLDERPKVGLVNCFIKYKYIDAFDKVISKIVQTDGDGEVWKGVVVENYIRDGSVPMIRRSCFDKVGVFSTDPDVGWCDDWDMWIRIAKHYHFALIKEPLVFYRKHVESTSNKYRSLIPQTQAVLERTFGNVSSELQYLKAKSYGYNYRYAAWLALAVQNWREARGLHRQAINHDPRLRYTKNSLLSSLNILKMSYENGPK